MTLNVREMIIGKRTTPSCRIEKSECDQRGIRTRKGTFVDTRRDTLGLYT